MRRLALLALTAACLLPASAAARQPPLTLLAYSTHGIAGLDGSRGFYEWPEGTVQIVNAATGTTRAVELPNGCENLGIGGPELLLSCSETYRIWNSWTGATVATDASRCESPERVSLRGIGRYWIAGSYDTGEPTYDDQGVRELGRDVELAVYIKRRTGRCRVLTGSDFNGDLNSPQVPRRHYQPDRCTSGKVFIVEFRPSHGTYVKLCRPRARWRPTGCNDATIGRALVACVVKDHLRVYLPTSRRHLSWRVPVLTTHPSLVYETVIDNRAYAMVAREDGEDPNGVPIYSVDLSALVRR